jgi:hypothetical protein
MARSHPHWRRLVRPLTASPPLTRSEPQALWTLREYTPDGAFAHCTLCRAGDGYELIIEGIAGGALRWGYHSLAAAEMGATRLRTRLLERGWRQSALDDAAATADHEA